MTKVNSSFVRIVIPCQDEEIQGFIVMLMEVLTGLTLIPAEHSLIFLTIETFFFSGKALPS